MSTPQVEDGYTKLANELLEALIRAGLSKREWTVVMTVIRKTYGFNKKTDDMTLTQIANMSGMDLAHVSRTVGGLAESNILLKRQGRYGYVLGINKNYRGWMTCQNGNLAKTASDPCQNGKIDLPKRQPQKTTPKDTTKINMRFAEFWDAYPRKKSKGQAEKTWVKLNPDEQLFNSIMAGLEQAKTSVDWTDPKFIPHPSTWLNAKGWEDEYEQKKKRGFVA